MRTKIKAVIFDVGGVLAMIRGTKKEIIGHHPYSLNSFMVKKLKIDFDTWFDAISDLHTDASRGIISKNKTLFLMEKRFNVDKKKIEKYFIKAYERTFKRNRELYRFAYKLKKKGYKIAILSDQWHVSKKVLIKKKDARRFDVVVISCDVGMTKPDTRIYKHVLRKLGFMGREVVFVDNREWNVKGARKIGIRGIIFNDNKHLFSRLKRLGVKV